MPESPTLIGQTISHDRIPGHLGGFNFRWAWASGVAAGRAV